MHFMGKLGFRKGLEKVSKRSQKGLGKTLTIKKKHFLTFTLSVNKIIIYQFSMFKSLDSIASVVGIFMYLTISKFKQVLRSRKGLDYNTALDSSSGVVRMCVQIPAWSVMRRLCPWARHLTIIASTFGWDVKL